MLPRPEQEQRQLAEALYETSLALNSTLNLDELLELILATVERVVPHDAADIMLLNKDIARIVRHRGYLDYGKSPITEMSFPLTTYFTLRRMYETGDPLLIPDIEQLPEWVRSPDRRWIRGYIGAPIRSKGEVVGFLNLASTAPNFFNLTHMKRLQAFANQVGIAIGNARLLEAERKQREIASTLLEATAALIAPVEAWEVINNILIQLGRVVPYDSASVFLLEGRRLNLVAGHGLPHSEVIGQIYLLEDDLLFEEITRTQQPIHLTDAQSDPRFKSWGAAYYIHGWMGVPLIARGQVIGCLTIDSRRPNAYGAAETTLVQSFANQAAIAITNSQLFEQTQVALARTEALYQATRRLIGVENLTDLLQAVVDGTAEALPAHRVTLILVDLDQRQATHFVDGGTENSDPYRASFEELWAGLTGWVLRELKPALSLKGIPDEREGPQVKQRRLERDTGSIIVVPLQYRGQVIGTLTSANRLAEPDFTEQDVELLVIMANQAAVAVDNVRLLEAERLARKQAEILREETRQSLAQTTRLYELSVEFVSALSVAEVAHLVIEKVVQAIHAHSAVINLLDEAGNFEAAFVVRAAGVAGVPTVGAAPTERAGKIGASAGPPQEAAPRPDGSTMIICRTGEAMIINDTWLTTETVHPYLIEQGIRASIGLPLKTREQTIGALFVRFEQPRQFSQREVETLFIFANQAAIAIQNARLYQIQKRIQRQERMAAVGQLAAGIAHDFNNILTSIIGFAELLQANPDLPDSAQADLERITKQGQRAARLVRQILDFSSQTITEKRPLNLKLSLNEMIKLLERTIPEDIRISLADTPIVARTTEAESQEYLVTADLAQLQQAITNLALNARDAMPEGGRLHFQLAYLRLSPPESPPISGMAPGNWIRLSVSDNGVGIPPHLHTQIFEPFFTTKEVGQGTGLGLAQVYGIIKQHEGYINVESEPGAGATFNIYLPALASSGGSPSPEEPCEGTAPRGKGETILLVEDDASVRYIGTTMLQHLGYKVLTASQGQEALQVYEQHQAEIKVVLTDMTMPKMGGAALAALLYQKNASLKMVMLTGYPLKTGAEELQTPGVEDWLQKPLKLEQLAQTLYRILR